MAKKAEQEIKKRIQNHHKQNQRCWEFGNVDFVDDGFEFGFYFLSSFFSHIRSDNNVRIVNSRLGQQARHTKELEKIRLPFFLI